MQISDIINILLKNRGLTTSKEIQDFYNPPSPLNIPITALGWSKHQLSSAIDLIDTHIKSRHPIAVYGDYDVDGITSTAILWETLYRFSRECFPYIPHRRREGYGLTRTGIDNCLEKGAKLIIVADSGITAVDEIAYCRSRGCDMIIIDHHQPPEVLPDPNVLLFSTATSAAGLSWFFAREYLLFHRHPQEIADEMLSLCAISVICDLVPLLGINRSLAKYGLEILNKTSRPGLLALIAEAGIFTGKIGPYEVGFIIGPRLNAMGRLEHALDSLRLLCTRDGSRALSLAHTLGQTNKLRQDLTLSSVEMALSQYANTKLPAVILISHESFDEGVIGLIAAKLVEKFNRPSLVVSVGQDVCKGSGRSVSGFNLTDFLRQHKDYLLSVGGHEMAAGFSLSPDQLKNFSKAVSKSSNLIDTDKFVRHRHIDADIQFDLVGEELFLEVEKFAPFGLSNPRPVFSSSDISVIQPKWVGSGAQHLKFIASGYEAIYFQAPSDLPSLKNPIQLVYSLNKNSFNGMSRLQLFIKEINGSAT